VLQESLPETMTTRTFPKFRKMHRDAKTKIRKHIFLLKRSFYIVVYFCSAQTVFQKWRTPHPNENVNCFYNCFKFPVESISLFAKKTSPSLISTHYVRSVTFRTRVLISRKHRFIFDICCQHSFRKR